MVDNELNDIINGCSNWNKESQEKLYRLFSKPLYKTCCLYAKNEDEAADLLHDTFIHVFKNIQQFNFQGSFEGWIKKVCVNLCLQEIRIQNKIKEVSLEAGLHEIIEAEDNSGEIEIQNESVFSKVLEEINKLPAKAALVIKLYIFEGWSHAQIAEELDISIGTSKSQLNYARKLIKERCYAK
ncbi:MAG: RNA polymerase sigma factor [Flavobacteriia bacterium]